MKHLLYGVLAILCLLLQACQVKPLAVGDRLPAHTFTSLVNSPEQALKLSDYSNQLIILDFWASWCASCKQGLVLIDSLQKNYPGKMQVLLVSSKTTGDTHQRIQQYYSRPANSLINKYISITEDTWLKNRFPHTAVPHYIWLYNGEVKAIASWRDLKTQNVDTILAGGSFLPQKRTVNHH